MRGSEFMLQMVSNLVKDRGVAESTANQYIQSLYSLHNKTPFNNLSWLKDTVEIEKRLAEFAPSTQKSYVSAVVSFLTAFKDKPTYKKVYQHYYDLMMKTDSTVKEAPNTKTDKQRENWVEWEDVEEKRVELRKQMLEFGGKKHISPSQYDILLRYVVLSLYTDIQPRRNQDYMDMWVVKKWTDDMPKDKNYLDLGGAKFPKQFIFNKYKTAKKYGQQIIEIPDTGEQPLGDALFSYLRHHPLNNAKTKEYKFLVAHDGTPLTTVNAITRILNKIFGKKIGSSQLRHIYITNKYGDQIESMREDSLAMGHSIDEQQKVYNVPL